MVNSSEFRIGNWAVNYGNYVCIEADDIVDCHHQPESYDPIPLTPEILEKAAFKKQSKNFYTIGDDLITVIFYMTSSFRVFYQIDNEIKHIRYFHQLQNLHFVLTGEELQIEL